MQLSTTCYNMTTLFERLQTYVPTMKQQMYITDKQLVIDLLASYPDDFFFKTKLLTIRKIAAIIWLKGHNLSEPTCMVCGKSVSDKFPHPNKQTIPDRITPFGSWCKTCCLNCNQKLIDIEGKRTETWIKKYGADNPMKNKEFAKAAIAKRNTDWVKVGYKQQERRLGERGVKKEFIESIDFSCDKSKADALIRIAEEFKAETGKEPDRFDLAERTGMNRTMINRWLAKIPEYHMLFRSGNSVSRAQIQVDEFIKNLGVETNISNRKLIAPYELDIFIPAHNLAIEYHGVWAHSEGFGGHDSKYHLNKTDMCEKIGIQLLQIYDTEWEDPTRQMIWKSIIKHKLGLTENKVYARECILREIESSTAKNFLENNHLSGYVKTSNHIGLFYQDKLQMVLSYGKSRFDDSIEIIRLAAKVNTVVVGGISKMLNYVKGLHSHITCFADRRYSSLKNCGYTNSLEYVGVTGPNWWGFDKKEYVLQSRFQYMKHKLKDKFKNFDESKSAFENMLKHNHDRIWDSGNLKFEYKK